MQMPTINLNCLIPNSDFSTNRSVAFLRHFFSVVTLRNKNAAKIEVPIQWNVLPDTREICKKKIHLIIENPSERAGNGPKNNIPLLSMRCIKKDTDQSSLFQNQNHNIHSFDYNNAEFEEIENENDKSNYVENNTIGFQNLKEAIQFIAQKAFKKQHFSTYNPNSSKGLINYANPITVKYSTPWSIIFVRAMLGILVLTTVSIVGFVALKVLKGI